MIRTARLLALALAAFLPAAAAGAAETIVGTATLDLHDSARGRKVVSEIWFAAAPGAAVERFSPRLPLRAIAIARGAEPAAALGRRPLIVLSHGNWGTRFSQGWLAVELVRAGYLVLSTSHPGTVADEQTVAGRYRLWDRSRDVSFALDEVLKHPKWSGLIDADRIGFAGHSFGGWTGVSLAGGRYDPVRQRAACARMAPPRDYYCENTLKDEIAGIPAADGGASFRDGRLRAFYIMASGPGQGFEPETLKAIAVPFLVDTAQFDESLEPATNSTALARQIAGAREIVRPVGHFAYVPQCRWLVGSLVTWVAGLPLCDDRGSVERAALQRQVAPDVLAFFGQTLGRGE
jgi:predicted dienelactone hydrolase